MSIIDSIDNSAVAQGKRIAGALFSWLSSLFRNIRFSIAFALSIENWMIAENVFIILMICGFHTHIDAGCGCVCVCVYGNSIKFQRWLWFPITATRCSCLNWFHSFVCYLINFSSRTIWTIIKTNFCHFLITWTTMQPWTIPRVRSISLTNSTLRQTMCERETVEKNHFIEWNFPWI